MCSTDLTSCHQNLLGGAGHQKGSNPEGECGCHMWLFPMSARRCGCSGTWPSRFTRSQDMQLWKKNKLQLINILCERIRDVTPLHWLAFYTLTINWPLRAPSGRTSERRAGRRGRCGRWPSRSWAPRTAPSDRRGAAASPRPARTQQPRRALSSPHPVAYKAQ